MSALLGSLFLVVVLPFYHFKNVVPRPLACRVSVEKSADTLPMFFLCLWFLLIWLLWVSTCFSLCWSCLGLSISWNWVFPFSCCGYFELFCLQILAQVCSLSPRTETPVVWMLVQSVLFRGLSFHVLCSLFCSWRWFPSFCVQLTLSVLLPHLFWFWSLLMYFSFQFNSVFSSVLLAVC